MPILVPLAEQIACIKREMAMRDRVYPRWVESGLLNQADADKELIRMAAVLETLEQLEVWICSGPAQGRYFAATPDQEM